MGHGKVKNGLYWSEASRTYHYQVRIGGVKRSGDTGHALVADARDFLLDLRAEAARRRAGLAPAPKPSAVTLDQAIDMWVAASRGRVSDRHLVDRPYVLRRHFKSVLHRPLAELTTAALDRVQAEYLAGERTGHGWGAAKARKPASWNNVRKDILALANWCVERDLLPAVPFRSKPIKVQKTVKATLWPEAVPKFLAAVDRLARSEDKKTAILLMVSLGLRENEALGARWEGFDERIGVYCPPNTKNREVRAIALPPGLLDGLRRDRGWKGERGLIMPAANGAPHVSAYTEGIVAKAGEEIGIVGLSPHCLRATFATAHWEAGTPLGEIMAMLGHSDAATTMIYIRQRPRDASEAQAKVAITFGLRLSYGGSTPRSSPPAVPPKKRKKQGEAMKTNSPAVPAHPPPKPEVAGSSPAGRTR